MQPSQGVICISEILSSSVSAPLSLAAVNASCTRISVFPPLLGLQTIPRTFSFRSSSLRVCVTIYFVSFFFDLPFLATMIAATVEMVSIEMMIIARDSGVMTA